MGARNRQVVRGRPEELERVAVVENMLAVIAKPHQTMRPEQVAAVIMGAVPAGVISAAVVADRLYLMDHFQEVEQAEQAIQRRLVNLLVIQMLVTQILYLSDTTAS